MKKHLPLIFFYKGNSFKILYGHPVVYVTFKETLKIHPFSIEICIDVCCVDIMKR